MNLDGRYQRLPGGKADAGVTGLVGRLVGFVVGALLLVGALLFSVVLFAVLAVVAVLAGGYLWWKTRALRRQMRAQMEQMQQAMQQHAQHAPEPAQGTTIEGEYVRESAHPRPEDQAPR